MNCLVLLIKFSSISASFRLSDTFIGKNLIVIAIRTNKDETVTNSLINLNSDDFSGFEYLLKSGLLMVWP